MFDRQDFLFVHIPDKHNWQIFVQFKIIPEKPELCTNAKYGKHKEKWEDTMYRQAICFFVFTLFCIITSMSSRKPELLQACQQLTYLNLLINHCKLNLFHSYE